MIDAEPLSRVQARFHAVAQTKTGDKIVAENRKAFHDYFIEERFETGIVLTGTEIKSARMGKVQLRDAYAEVLGTEVWLMNAHFSPYSHGNIWNHEPTKKRKLLLNKTEIRRLIGKTRQKGLTLVPLKMYLKNGWLKCDLALVRGKKQHDKREAIQEREQDREARAAMSRRNLKFHE